MKLKLLIILAMITLILGISSKTHASEEVVSPDAIDVDGYVKEQLAQDQEMIQLKEEIKRQKEEIILNREKSKQFKQLSKSVEKLSETTVEYLEEKKAAQAGIAEYNAKVKCMQMDNPGVECDRFIRKRRQ